MTVVNKGMSEERSKEQEVFVTKISRIAKVGNVDLLRAYIPRAIVKRFNLKPGDKIVWRVQKDRVEIVFER